MGGYGGWADVSVARGLRLAWPFCNVQVGCEGRRGVGADVYLWMVESNSFRVERRFVCFCMERFFCCCWLMLKWVLLLVLKG